MIVSARVHRRRRGEERRVDDEEVLDVVRAAERIEHRCPRIGAEAQRAALVRGVLRAVRVPITFQKPRRWRIRVVSRTSCPCARRLLGR